MITIKEIAERAGVSPTTVSNVLHGNMKKVSPAMVKKIQSLLEECNYVPRFGLNALTNRKSGMIGVLINTPEFVERTPYERPFYGNVIGVLENYFRERGYYIMVCSTGDMQEVMTMVLGWNVDGVITISLPKKYYEKIRQMTNKPVVSIDMDDETSEVEDCYNVTSDDIGAGELMMKHLISKGICDVVYVANVKKGADYRRYEGANQIYKEYYGMKEDLEFALLGNTYDKRLETYKKYKNKMGKNAALFFSTDLNAVEAIGYYWRRGIRVPEDISIVGCDDDIFARLSMPRLTTIKIDSGKKAVLAGETMMKFLEGEKALQKSIYVDISLIERESVRED